MSVFSYIRELHTYILRSNTTRISGDRHPGSSDPGSTLQSDTLVVGVDGEVRKVCAVPNAASMPEAAAHNAL